MALGLRIHKWLRWIAIILFGLVCFDGFRWWQAERLNRSIADGSIISNKEKLPPEALFAQGFLFAQKGDREQSIALYKRIEAGANIGLAQEAKYNRANIYLLKAMEISAGDNPNSGMPLAELAKDTYRSILRLDPGYWDAKYNLERALRLVPDPDDSDDADLPPPQQSERAPTTMRGFTLGLP